MSGQKVHGTEGGAKMHRRNDEKPCAACLDAESSAARQRRATSPSPGGPKPNLTPHAREDWREQAACKGLAAVMGPPVPSGPLHEAAAAICRGCPVLAECFTWVLGLPEHEDPGGTVAGLTASERQERRRRARRPGHPSTT